MKKFCAALLIFIVGPAAMAQSGKPGTAPAPILGPMYPDQVYIKENARLRKVIPYTPLREADVAWSKRVWRTVDLREKFNLPLYYPESRIADRRSLYDVIKDELTKPGSTLHAFSNPALDDEFRIPMTPTELDHVFVEWDSAHVEEDPNVPGKFDTIPLPDYLTSSEIKQFWIKEDWFQDKQRSVQDVRILGLCPLKEKSINGTVVGLSPLFWIYYPEWRGTFANAEVYNEKSDVERRTIEDVIWKRKFHSFIHKESNVYDRHIQSYATGLDALLESDRIKYELSTIEHDVWHF